MASSVSSAGYEKLLDGEDGFLLAVALTVLVVLVVSFVTKLYFSWQRYNITKRQVGPTDRAVVVSDAIWLLSHIFAFVYVGLRISTLGGLTNEESNASSEARKTTLGRANLAALIFFVLSLYLSFCSALCIVLAVNKGPKDKRSALRNPTYFAPSVIFVIGILVTTLPQIGCDGGFVFQSQQNLCPLANARLTPTVILVTVLDAALTTYWAAFVYRQLHRPNGRVTARQWPVTSFMLRFLIVAANIVFIDLYVRANANSVPYCETFYPELLSVLMSLTATTTVSMSRILNKFNFAGVAYAADPTQNRSHLQSSAGQSISGARAGSIAQQQALNKVRLSSRDLNLWKEKSVTLNTNVSAQSDHRSGSEILSIQPKGESITRRVDIQQDWESSGGSGQLLRDI